MTTTLDAIDCQSFAGGFTLGAVQAGFRLVGKRENVGGFGVPSCENNRALLGNDWQTDVCEPAGWTPYSVPFVFGNPPCSGFSMISHKSFRGADSKINQCMWDFAQFAARCQPEIMIFESVTNAYKAGRDLMRGLRAEVERMTGQQWHLTHVLHNAYDVGGASVRKRYFFVCHRIPFGVEHVELDRKPLMHEVIADLFDMSNTIDAQPYRYSPTWFSERYRSSTGLVDGHVSEDNTTIRRNIELVDGTGIEWGYEEAYLVARRYFEKYGELPATWRALKSYDRRLREIADDVPFDLGFGTSQMSRWNPLRPSRVVTGDTLTRTLHPYELRCLTHREALRMMGFPDAWSIADVYCSKSRHWWGKGVTVDCGRWASTWARNSILGSPGSIVGETSGDRESTINMIAQSYAA